MEAGAGHLDRVPRSRMAAVLAAAALAGLGIGIGWHLLATAPPSPATPVPAFSALHGAATWAPGARPAPAITALRDQTGGSFSLSSLRGRTVAMVFFDSHCHQQCPLAGRALAAAERSLPPAQRPVLVVVSVNPLDTASSSRAAARAWGLAGLAPWHWLRGTHRQLARAWTGYGIDVKPERGDISHTEALYLIDRHGDERSAYLFPYVPSFVEHDMRTLASSPEPDGRRA